VRTRTWSGVKADYLTSEFQDGAMSRGAGDGAPEGRDIVINAGPRRAVAP